MGKKDEADTLVDETLQGLDLDAQDPLNQTLDNLNANQGQDIFSMEEIKLDKSDEINIPYIGHNFMMKRMEP